MSRTISDRIVTARKHYKCDAYREWIRAGYTQDDCETSDQRLIVQAAEADNGIIRPGQPYRKVVMVHEGSLCTYRARICMETVCRDLGLFDE